MSLRMLPLDEVLDFFNGKAPVPAEDGEYTIFGSNGPIGRSKQFNHESAIILGRVGAYCGSVVICHEKFWASDNTIVIKSKDGFDLRYIYYRLLSSPLRSYAGGAAQPLLTHTILNAVRLKLHTDQAAQQRVAETLSTYDYLIENNRRRIQLLEQAARLLYKEWFVHLHFPGHEHVKISDGAPEGWARKQLAQLTTFLNRGIAPKYDDDADGIVINQRCIRSGRLDISLARRQSREFTPDRQVQVGDVLINSTGEGTLGRVAQVIASVSNCTVDTHVTIARPTEEMGIHYFGQAVMEWEPRFSIMGRGATNQTELSRSQIGAVEILIPAPSIMQQFEDFAGPVCRQISTLMEKNEKLRAARDILLPRLMNGEIAV